MAQLVDLNGLNKAYSTNKQRIDNVIDSLESGSIVVKNSEYATKIGSLSSHSQIGSTNVPVYVDSDGVVTPITITDSLSLGYNVQTPYSSFGYNVSIGSPSVSDVYLGLERGTGTVIATNSVVHSKSYTISEKANIGFDSTLGNGGAITFNFL